MSTTPITSETRTIVLLVDPDARSRALLAQQLSSDRLTIVEAADGVGALRILGERDVRVVVTELYVQTDGDDYLVPSIRRAKAHRKTRIVAHTNRSLTADRDWAMRAGADAYLIKPTRADRMRYVVGRLSTERASTRSDAGLATKRPESPYHR